MQELLTKGIGHTKFKKIKTKFQKILTIPDKWDIVSLIDTTSKKSNSIVDGPFGSNLKTSDYDEKGKIPVLMIQMLYDINTIKQARCITEQKFNEIKRSKIVSGDILVAKIGNTYGLTCIYPDNFPVAMISANLCKITIDEKKFNRNFVNYWLNTSIFKNYLDIIVSKSGQPAFGITEFKKLPIVNPLKSEQDQIASILSNMDFLIHQTDGLIEQNQRLKKGLMQQLFSKGIGHTKFKISRYGKISDVWSIKKLKDVCVKKDGIQTGPFGSLLHERDYQESGTPIITVEHLGENHIIHKNLPLVSDKDRDRLSKYIIKNGDMVFSRVGSVDRCALVKQEEDGWLFSGRCLRVRPNSNIMDSSYLSWLLGYSKIKARIRSVAVGATMPSLNTSLLSNIEIIVPELKEQQKISSILSNIDFHINELKLKKTKLKKQKKGLVQKLLSGQIRVNTH